MIRGLVVHEGESKITTPDGHAVRLSPKQFKIIEKIAMHDQAIPLKKIIGHVYADDIDGGPLSAESTVKVYIHLIRQRIKHTDLQIYNVAYTKHYGLDLKSNGRGERR